MVSKEFLKNSFSFSRYHLSKSKNSVGQIIGFYRFPKNIVGRFLSVTSLMISTLSTKLTFIQNTRILFPQSQASRKFILTIFMEYFVVYPVEPQERNSMSICPILSPYFSGPWSWTSGVSVSQ